MQYVRMAMICAYRLTQQVFQQTPRSSYGSLRCILTPKKLTRNMRSGCAIGRWNIFIKPIKNGICFFCCKDVLILKPGP